MYSVDAVCVVLLFGLEAFNDDAVTLNEAAIQLQGQVVFFLSLFFRGVCVCVCVRIAFVCVVY